MYPTWQYLRVKFLRHCRDKRRNSHWKLSLPGMAKCPKCGEMKLAHRMCKACGYYNGREVKSVKEA